MNLNFAKTAPGVMTASWMHPKSGRQYSVAIIESCDTQHLFIDGELVARELATFDDAVVLAKQKLSTKQSTKLVRMAGALVVASVIGASVIAASKFMPQVTAADLAAAVPGSTVAAATVEDDAKASIEATSGATITANLVSDDRGETIETDVQKRPAPELVEKVAVTPLTQPVEADAQPESTDAVNDEPRRFSARNNLLALQALTEGQPEPEAKAKVAKPATDTTPPRQRATSDRTGKSVQTVAATSAPPSPPSPPRILVIPAKSPVADVRPVEQVVVEVVPSADVPPPAVASVEADQDSREEEFQKPLVRPMIPTPFAEDTDTETENALDRTETAAAPPLPAKTPELAAAPVNIAPVTRNADASPPPRKASVANKVQNAKSRSSGRSTRSLPRRKTRRSSSRRIVNARPQGRLVCFAHICRWR
jgi:hypothetical protein